MPKYGSALAAIISDERLAARYLAGENTTTLATQLGMSRTSIWRSLRRLSVPMRAGRGMIPERFRQQKLSAAQSSDVVRRYGLGESLACLGAAYGVSGSTIGRYLVAHAAVRRPPGLSGWRRYTVDEHAFDALTPDAAYWLGFAITDGYVRLRPEMGSYALGFHISARDRAHLESFRNFLGCNAPIREIQPRGSTRGDGAIIVGGPSVAITVSSKRLVEKVVEWGVTPRKTGNAEPHPALVHSAHFWRGVLDGDGSVWFSRNGVLHVGLHSASPKLIAAFARFALAMAPGFRARVVTRRPRPWSRRPFYWFGLNGRHAQRLVKIIWSNGGPALARKSAVVLSAT